MAIRYAVATGNWNNVAIWDGGATLPTVGDDVYANGFTVTINQDILVDKITNNICPTTGLSGGKFTCTTSRNILCTVESFNETCLNLGGIITVTVGKLVPINARAIYFGVFSVGISQLTVIGDCSASDNANTIEIEGNGGGRDININIIGNGNSTASKQIIKSISNIRFQNLNITGNFTSGGAICFNSPITSFVGIGSFKASATASVIVDASTCLGNISGTLENVNSRMAVVFNSMYLSPTASLVWKFYNSDDVEKSLYTDDAFDYADVTDTRDGVVYANGTKTGTLKVPAPSLVVKDVPTDDTVGTWAFDSALISRLENVVTEEILVTQLGNLNFD